MASVPVSRATSRLIITITRYKCLRHDRYSVLQGFMSASSISLDEWSVRYSMIHCQVVCYNISDMYVQLSFMQQLDVSGSPGASWIVFSSWHGLQVCGSWYQSVRLIQIGTVLGGASAVGLYQNHVSIPVCMVCTVIRV